MTLYKRGSAKSEQCLPAEDVPYIVLIIPDSQKLFRKRQGGTFLSCLRCLRSLKNTTHYLTYAYFFSASRLEKLLTSYDAWAGLRFWGFEPPILFFSSSIFTLCYWALGYDNICPRGYLLDPKEAYF